MCDKRAGHSQWRAWSVCIEMILFMSPFSKGHNLEKRALIFPPTSLYGTFVAIAVPLDIPDRNVFVSYNFESNYSVVTNITQIDEVIFPNLPVIAARHSRSITRELAYTTLETKFQEHGMSGRECMLRNICEAAETPLHHNGLLGHIMHIVFTPSSSREEGLEDVYYEAEADGLRGDCDKYFDLCPYSLFDVITRLVEMQQKPLQNNLV
ncbi:jg27894 [Pararge aegeria aegeria]|uniref:Jg27894 protein n=1 Tax=Pararge aegeria aegeria TaxID=348720 RepID=A0A8S4SK01_9NEOP|nr:jg27894 [Pararge aegeria aegeria]